MYADLLTQALGKERAAPRSNDLLLADLRRSRARLRAEDTATTPAPADEALARELSYDGDLLRLCEALDVRAATPAGFENPVQERARLEHELAARGVTLGASTTE
ncbi:MAG TPA: hypothetical protein VG346_03465 [Acidimicrobiales bacterium]|jgi:hypothetical protein|nr:hypothetical protein [Acidimicrobiales bacterium]